MEKKPFDLVVPDETRLRFFKLKTPRRDLVACSWCGRLFPLDKIDSGRACNRCRIDELGKGE